MRGAMGMMMGGVPELKLSASPSNNISGFMQAGPVTINVTGGPSGVAPSITWTEVYGDVQPGSPSAFSTYFYPESHFGSSGVWRATVTRGAAVKSIDITVGINGYEHLVVTGGGPDVHMASLADGSFSIGRGFSVSGGSGDFTVLNSLGGSSLHLDFNAGPGSVPSGQTAGPFVIGVQVTDNVTGEVAGSSAAYYVTNYW